MVKRSFLTLVFMMATSVVWAQTLSESVILIVGDSLSAAYGINPQQGWVSLLKQRLEKVNLHYHVVNSSVSGNTSSNGLAQLPAVLKQYHPQVVIVELGANDALRGVPLATTKQNLSRIIMLAQQAHAKVILLGIRIPNNYGPQFNALFQSMFQQLSQRYSIRLVPRFLQGVDENEQLLQADRMHPNEAAQRYLLNTVWPHLLPLLKQ